MAKTVTEINKLNNAVNDFSEKMKDRLTEKAAKGYRNWDVNSKESLYEGLMEKFEKIKRCSIPEDEAKCLIDIANFAMFINKAITEKN